jgi:hypothetical protein
MVALAGYFHNRHWGEALVENVVICIYANYNQRQRSERSYRVPRTLAIGRVGMGDGP